MTIGGRSARDGETKRFTVHTYLTSEEKEELAQYATEKGLSQSATIRQLIREAVGE